MLFHHEPANDDAAIERVLIETRRFEELTREGTALGLMEFVTPEEIADNVVREILSHPTGKRNNFV